MEIERLAIMGGTFDPIHYGHLVAAEAARMEFALDQVVFVPSGQPPHKRGLDISPVKDRWNMTTLAAASNPYFKLSKVEIERSGPSYTVDTIGWFKEKFGLKTEIFFITGADAILEILTWKKVDLLIDLCKFIAVTRPGFDLNKLSQLLPERYVNKIKILEVPGLDISSTGIRLRVKEGRTIKYLVPEKVENYILENKLYLS